jgi:hypothetical protein
MPVKFEGAVILRPRAKSTESSLVKKIVVPSIASKCCFPGLHQTRSCKNSARLDLSSLPVQHCQSAMSSWSPRGRHDQENSIPTRLCLYLYPPFGFCYQEPIADSPKWHRNPLDHGFQDHKL